MKNSILALSVILIWIVQTSYGQSPLPVAGTANATASTSGNWSDANTWSAGAVPSTDARVLIPENITVTIASKLSASYKSVRIDGTLKFANDVDTELSTEFLVSSMSGSLEIGTSTAPIASNVSAKIIVADRGGTTTTDDPERFAPGIILMGPVRMYGTEKTSWTTLEQQPAAGATTLTVKSSPTGWAVGDQLILPATQPGDFTSDEIVTISSINGTQIGLSTATTKPHQAPSEASHLDVHVANLTRNILLTSENSSVSAKRRGHVMFMHNLDVDMRYVELTNMGRTDKSIPLDDYTWPELEESPSFRPPRGAYNNPRGRYSVHFHRGGFNPSLKAAHVEGVTVNNDPGWGYVNHSSRVDFVRNVSYDVVGGAFNTESGDETGSFVENIALRTVNPQDPQLNPRHPNALVDIREEFQDFAWQGDAFWFHSLAVKTEGNVAAGVSGHAFVWWPEGLIENGLGMVRANKDLHITDASQRALLDQSTMGADFVLECWMVPAAPFKDNTAYTISKGVVGYYVHTRFLDEIEEKNNIVGDAYRNTLDFLVENTTLWNIRSKGVEFLFSSHISFKGNQVYGYNSPASAYGMKLNHFHNLDDWDILDNRLEGFNNANVALATPTNATVKIDGGLFNNSSTDISIGEVNFLNLPENEDEEAEDDESGVIGKTARTMSISNVNFQQMTSNIVMDADFNLINQDVQDGLDVPDEVKTVLYFLLNDEITLNYGPFQNTRLYFEQSAADFIPITSANATAELEAETITIPSQYHNLTNQQLRGITNPPSSFGGAIMPSDALSHPSITGGRVGAITPCTTAPELPSQFTAAVDQNNCSTVLITWNNVTCTDSYGLQKSVDGGDWVDVNAQLSTNSYVDAASYASEVRVKYRIRAQSTLGNSSYTESSEIQVAPCPSCTAAPAQPAQLLAMIDTEDCSVINISWDVVACSDNYALQRQIDGGDWIDLATAITTNAYVDQATFDRGTTIKYRLRAQSSLGNSSYVESTGLLVTSCVLNASLDFINKGNIIVSPNPTNGQLILQSDFQDRKVGIHALDGTRIREMNTAIDFDVSDLPTGIYLIIAEADDQHSRVTQRLIKR